MREVLTEFANSPAGMALIAALAAMFADFTTGSFAALRDGTFTLNAVAAFLRKHAAGRIGPLASLLFIGYFAGETAGQLFLAAAIAGLAAYAAETAASIIGNINPPKETKVVDTFAETLNPVPKE